MLKLLKARALLLVVSIEGFLFTPQFSFRYKSRDNFQASRSTPFPSRFGVHNTYSLQGGLCIHGRERKLSILEQMVPAGLRG